MGGRPTIVGLIAAAVIVLGAGGVAGTRTATAEIRVPLPGSDNAAKKRKRVRAFRPTRPSRNPTRTVAGITAAAVSPEGADRSDAMAVVGTSSSASVTMALPARKRTAASPSGEDVDPAARGEAARGAELANLEAPAPGSTSPAPEDASAEDASAPSRDAAEDVAAEPSALSESAAQDAPDRETAEDETAVDGPDREPDTSADGDADPAATASEEAQPLRVAAADGAETDRDTETTTPRQDEAVADANNDSAPDQTSDPQAESAATPAETDRGTSSGPSVVLKITPPPDFEPAEAGEEEVETADAALDPNDLASSQKNVALSQKDDEETGDGEIKVAALTPPDAPAEIADAPASPAAEDDKGEENTTATVETGGTALPGTNDAEAGGASASDTASSDADPAVAGQAADAADHAPDASDSGAAAPSEAGTAGASDTASPDGEAVTATEASIDSDEAAAEAPPPPPPAHPVVAAVREKLERPEDFKGLAKSDIAALTAFYGTYEEPPLWIAESGFTGKAKTVIATIGKADEWGLEASSFEVPAAGTVPASEAAQADAEIALSAAVLSYARDAQIGRLTPSRVSKLFDQHPKLRDPKTALIEIAASPTPDRALLSLHPQHDEFKRLQQALMRARSSANATGRDPDRDRTVQRIVMNMERWRWLPRQLGNYYVWNNVPEFEVRVLKGGQTIYREKTIVGQYKYATPFFSAPMRNIVVHPNWTVPPTIVREDIAPKLKGPSGGGFFAQSKKNILRRFGLKVSYKGEPIDADTVDWNNVNIHRYTFTQDAGPANVLGQFKFNFPNKHAIYMHDTVQRELFSVRQRTLSHGCIRVHQPDRLAALLLGEDKGWSLNQVRSVVARNETKVISFKRRVPVHMTYFTTTVDETGTVREFADIYGIDNKMAPMLFTSPQAFPVPATPEVAETGGNTRSYQQQRRRRTSNNGLDGFLSGLFGN